MNDRQEKSDIGSALMVLLLILLACGISAGTNANQLRGSFPALAA